MNPASTIIQALFLHLRQENLKKKREKSAKKEYLKDHPFAQCHQQQRFVILRRLHGTRHHPVHCLR